MTIRVAILISGGGSNMVKLVQSMHVNHPGTPALVLSNKPQAGGLARAAALGIRNISLDHRAFATRSDFDSALDDTLSKAAIDYICLAGFMRILGSDFTKKWHGKMLNIHPSLLPKYKGLNTHARAIAAGDRLAGCSVHEVTQDLDDGPILGQARLKINADDTAQSLAARILPLEHRLYPAVLQRVLDGNRDCLYMDG